MTEPEVVVSIDGLPRPAVVVRRDEERVLVRFRQAGGFEERWVAASEVIQVETATSAPPLAKLVGLGLVGVLGLTLLLWPGGGSDKPLLSSSPSPTATTTPSPTPTTVSAVLFGDSFTAGKGVEPSAPTALAVAAKALRWQYVVKALPGSGFTTRPSYADRLAREVTTAPAVLVLQGGASDTDADPAQVTRAATVTLQSLHSRFPSTRLVLIGPVAMEQPVDQGLLRVSRALMAAAKATRVAYIDPIALGWITRANSQQYLARSGFYPNAAGHAYLGKQLETALRTALS